MNRVSFLYNFFLLSYLFLSFCFDSILPAVRSRQPKIQEDTKHTNNLEKEERFFFLNSGLIYRLSYIVQHITNCDGCVTSQCVIVCHEAVSHEQEFHQTVIHITSVFGYSGMGYVMNIVEQRLKF